MVYLCTRTNHTSFKYLIWSIAKRLRLRNIYNCVNSRFRGTTQCISACTVSTCRRKDSSGSPSETILCIDYKTLQDIFMNLQLLHSDDLSICYRTLKVHFTTNSIATKARHRSFGEALAHHGHVCGRQIWQDVQRLGRALQVLIECLGVPVHYISKDTVGNCTIFCWKVNYTQ